MEWYHCGRCGSLFRSPLGDADERVCAICGRDPSVGVEPVQQRGQGQAKPDAVRQADAEEIQDRRESRRSRRNRTVAILVLGWAVSMALIVVVVKLVWPENAREEETGDSVTSSIKGTMGDENVVKLDQAMPICSTALSGFLSASSSEERNQFVTDPVATASRMARFYSLNPVPRIDPGSLRNTENSLLKIAGKQALESRWKGPDGLLLDCVFIQQGDEWLLDWDHFARFQDCPWAVFASADGPEEGEFRLLVRQRVTRDGVESTHMDLVFTPPRFSRPKETGLPAVELIIRRESPEGQLLTAGFKQRATGTAPFGSTLKPLEDEDLLRVRVKMRRHSDPTGENGGKRFELVKVLACHWLNHPDPGVKPVAPAASAAPAPEVPAPPQP